ncbi:MAG: ComEC/Rec2 family competence protein [Planctomycetaceae bacterium]|nr:ComEC/Rec2 family competence protein [Planctomycetaceae bacterium]
MQEPQFSLRSPAPISRAAIAFVCGLGLGTVLPPDTTLWLGVSGALLFLRTAVRRRPGVSAWCLYISVGTLGIVHLQLTQTDAADNPLQPLFESDIVSVRAIGVVTSIPAVHLRPDLPTAPRLFGRAEQTRFRLRLSQLSSPPHAVSVNANCQVYIEGDAAGRVSVGDRISLIGRPDFPQPPGNPGSFDFAAYLRRNGIDGLLYAAHPDAVRVLESGAWWRPMRHIGRLRRAIRGVLSADLPEKLRGPAIALLLGDRNELSSDVENQFVASGTMHLLAISGLHVGILCLFLLRLLHVLLVRRRTALVVTFGICLTYALLTDLRPSVVRATVFFGVFAVGQWTRRGLSLSALISTTAVLMLIVRPLMILDVGAWLSFLAVTALGWADAGRREPDRNAEAPLPALTFRDRITDLVRTAGEQIRYRYRQMLLILLLTTPLVAHSFHVLAPVGLLVNVLLIPFTAVILACGYITIAVGLLLPSLAFVPAKALSLSMTLLSQVVAGASQLPGGHLYIADLPEWFLPFYFSLMLLIAVVKAVPLKRSGIALLLIGSAAALRMATGPNVTGTVCCTVLDVGHGSAAVAETGDGRVYLIDAGALNRGTVTADSICRFLWRRGYRRLSGIVVSHADLDHYNSVAGVLSKVPADALYVAPDFLASDAEPVQATLDAAEQFAVPIRLVTGPTIVDPPPADSDSPSADITTGTTISTSMSQPNRAADPGHAAFPTQAKPAAQRFPNSSRVSISIRRPSIDRVSADAEDNQRSLVVSICCGGRQMILPGDLEGPAAESVFGELGTAEVLVSPHHGSTDANTEELSSLVQPQVVIVSSRNTESVGHLRKVFPDTERLLFTPESGAVTVTWRAAGLHLSEFRRADSGNGSGR